MKTPYAFSGGDERFSHTALLLRRAGEELVGESYLEEDFVDAICHTRDLAAAQSEG
jgi:hypothetical protein